MKNKFLTNVIMNVLKKVLGFLMLGGVFYVVTSCTKEEVNYIEPNKKEDIKISSITFHSKDNPMQLIGDVTCDIIGDSIINCWIPYLITDKKLIANISYIGDKLLIDTVTYTTI